VSLSVLILAYLGSASGESFKAFISCLLTTLEDLLTLTLSIESKPEGSLLILFLSLVVDSKANAFGFVTARGGLLSTTGLKSVCLHSSDCHWKKSLLDILSVWKCLLLCLDLDLADKIFVPNLKQVGLFLCFLFISRIFLHGLMFFLCLLSVFELSEISFALRVLVNLYSLLKFVLAGFVLFMKGLP